MATNKNARKWRNIKPSKADIADSEYFMLLNYLTDELKETKAIQLTSAVWMLWWMHRFTFFFFEISPQTKLTEIDINCTNYFLNSVIAICAYDYLIK